MSWDSEERIQHLKDIERILRGEIDCDTKEEIKARPFSQLKDLPPPDRSKYRHFTRVIPRDEWGAIPSSEILPTPLVLPIHKIHYSYHRNWPICYTREECTQTLRMLQLREMNERGLPDLRHNFLIGNDCNVYEGRGWNYRAELPYDCDPREWDERSLDIGFFSESDDAIWAFDEMFGIAEELITWWQDNKTVVDKLTLI